MSFTLEDCTTENVSPLLHKIVENILTQSKTCDSVQEKLMLVLILVVMFENGFIIQNEENEVVEPEQLSLEILGKWEKYPGAFQISLALSGSYSIPLKLLISTLGTTIMVNLVINELDSETYTVCVPISRYVVSTQASTIPMIFRDLRHLSITLKNKVISAVKSRIISYYGFASASLIGLPEEVFFNIMFYLPIKDIINTSKTCKLLNNFINKEILWHSLFRRDFGEYDECSSWKMMYKDRYVQREDERLREAHRHAGTLHDYMDYSDLVSYVDNHMWGVIM